MVKTPASQGTIMVIKCTLYFKEISLNISEGQTKNRYFENSQKRNFARQLTN